MANITLRTHLIGSVTDFCNDSGLPFVTPEILVDLIVRLSRYQEEGVRLSPQVYLTDNIDSLISMLPDGEKLHLATSTPGTHGIMQMLKVCAPLTTGDWRLFGHKCADTMKFGVFRGSSSPLAVPVDDILLASPTDTSVVKVHQIADECVQIQNSRGTRHYVFFSHKKTESPPPLQHVDDFLASVTQKVAPKDKDTVHSYLKKVVTESLAAGHGCIWAVTTMSRPPRALKDGMFFYEPIDFHRMIKSVKAGDLSLDFLERKAELVRGMLCCDGISLFDDRGKLLGYRCFVSLSGSHGIIGGARKRAFAALKRHLRRGLSAVFLQSQDGLTEFQSARND